jgi:hypothetical protein
MSKPMPCASDEINQEFTRWAIDLIKGRKGERYRLVIKKHFLSSPMSRSCVAPEYQEQLEEALNTRQDL